MSREEWVLAWLVAALLLLLLCWLCTDWWVYS